MAEWPLFRDLIQVESKRVGSLVVRVSDQEELNLFYVPFFSSLSLIVKKCQLATDLELDLVRSSYKGKDTHEALVDWL